MEKIFRLFFLPIVSLILLTQCSPIDAPEFSPVGGTYNTDQMVTINSSAGDQTIHYTTDGSNPTILSPVYSVPIPVAGNRTTMTIKAIAIIADFSQSEITSADYKIQYKVTTPIISEIIGPDYIKCWLPGTFVVDISTLTAGTIIHYTTDGSDPTASSPEFLSASTVVGDDITIKFIAVKDEYLNSDIVSAKIPKSPPTCIDTPQVETPIINEIIGPIYIKCWHSGTFIIEISTLTAGATIHYTTNGSDPTASSPEFLSASIFIEHNITIKFIAVKDGYLNSDIVSAKTPEAPPTCLTP